MTTRYDNKPVVGYSEGLIISDSKPEKEVTRYSDNRPDNVNHWFTIGATRYNVHNYRSDLRGYPVRWFETVLVGFY